MTQERRTAVDAYFTDRLVAPDHREVEAAG
ncbi:MAG: hypothetical protein QOF26_4056, partial [Baekduia sp.]|nr:hypothetical protein [Baekduia sp.]